MATYILYQQVLPQYIAYTVFDGYDETISTKSNAHATRSKSKDSSQNVIVQEENDAFYSKERFLSNNHNKG